MSNNLEPVDYDIDYFDRRCEQEYIVPTIEQEERFLDRTWKLVDACFDENVARKAAWYEVMVR